MNIKLLISRNFNLKKQKNWRFDFLIVRKRILIEIVGSPWSVGRAGRKVANDFNKYNHAEELGYQIQRFEPVQVKLGFVINWIKEQFEDETTDQTISTTELD